MLSHHRRDNVSLESCGRSRLRPLTSPLLFLLALLAIASYWLNMTLVRQAREERHALEAIKKIMANTGDGIADVGVGWDYYKYEKEPAHPAFFRTLRQKPLLTRFFHFITGEDVGEGVPIMWTCRATKRWPMPIWRC